MDRHWTDQSRHGLVSDQQRHQRLEVEDDRVTDLHLWRLGPGHLGMIAVVVSDNPLSPDDYKARLAGIEGLSHVNIEVHACPGHSIGQQVA